MASDQFVDPNAVLRPVRPVGSVNPRFTQDGFMDSYWQQVQEQHQQGRPMYTQEDLQYYRNAHPIARALAEGDSHSFGPQTQAAASQEASSQSDNEEFSSGSSSSSGILVEGVMVLFVVASLDFLVEI